MIAFLRRVGYGLMASFILAVLALWSWQLFKVVPSTTGWWAVLWGLLFIVVAAISAWFLYLLGDAIAQQDKSK